MSRKVDIGFTLNGGPREVAVSTAQTALDMIRDDLGLTGTKYACGEGECGACTILVDGRSVCACLMFAVQCEGRDIETIEGVALSEGGKAVTRAFADKGAVQCGFCTPGLVVQASQLIARQPHAGRDAIKRGIEGNLCRCTGYTKIIDAIADITGGND